MAFGHAGRGEAFSLTYTARAAALLDDAGQFQHNQRFAQQSAADTELGGQVAFGWQAGPGLMFSFLEPQGDVLQTCVNEVLFLSIRMHNLYFNN